MNVYNSLVKCATVNIASSISKKSSVSSIYFDLLARLCNVLVLIKSSHIHIIFVRACMRACV